MNTYICCCKIHQLLLSASPFYCSILPYEKPFATVWFVNCSWPRNAKENSKNRDLLTASVSAQVVAIRRLILLTLLLYIIRIFCAGCLYIHTTTTHIYTVMLHTPMLQDSFTTRHNQPHKTHSPILYIATW